MSGLILGVVSNCWAAQLGEAGLEAECRRAAAEGWGYVELRQRALGRAEERVAGDDRPWPIPDALAALAAAVPGTGLNLAVEAPFLTTVLDPEDPYLLRCAAAARALSPADPVLRWVDLSPAATLLDHDEAIDELGGSVANVARRLAVEGVRLALENSRQPVAALRAVIRRASLSLPERVRAPELCWDPVNQVMQQLQPEDPCLLAEEVGLGELFMFHFKQCRDGQVLPDMAEGDVDWARYVRIMRRRGYQGPALFEIPPGPDARERLIAGRNVVQQLWDAAGND
ncbi:MAG: hypothetical protein FJX77_08365 [Armatimonadetes bacterium]|nr:hypothetical protein [Armatimonadota bacterium]